MQLGQFLLGVRQAFINDSAMEIGPEQAISSISMATYVEMPNWRAFRMSFLYHSRSCSRRCALFREKRWS